MLLMFRNFVPWLFSLRHEILIEGAAPPSPQSIDLYDQSQIERLIEVKERSEHGNRFDFSRRFLVPSLDFMREISQYIENLLSTKTVRKNIDRRSLIKSLAFGILLHH